MQSNKKFCRKCKGKIICTHIEPEMSPTDIVTLILTALLKNKEIGMQTLYRFMMPEYRRQIGGKGNIENYIKNTFPGLIQTDYVYIVDEFKEEDECIGYLQLQYKDENKMNGIKIKMERAFDYEKNKPLNDRYSGEKLHLFWRITGMEKI